MDHKVWIVFARSTCSHGREMPVRMSRRWQEPTLKKGETCAVQVEVTPHFGSDGLARAVKQLEAK